MIDNIPRIEYPQVVKILDDPTLDLMEKAKLIHDFDETINSLSHDRKRGSTASTSIDRIFHILKEIEEKAK